MRILALIIAALVIIFGARLLMIALQTIVSGKILVRRGVRREWQPAPHPDDVWKAALRDSLMGLLLLVLGVFLVV
jgi:hypothetical protein